MRYTHSLTYLLTYLHTIRVFVGVVNEVSWESDYLNSFERVTHHGDEHVGQDDDNGDVVERKQEQSDTLDHRRGVAAAGEARRKLAVVTLVWPLDLDFVDSHETEHGPEQTE